MIFPDGKEWDGEISMYNCFLWMNNRINKQQNDRANRQENPKDSIVLTWTLFYAIPLELSQFQDFGKTGAELSTKPAR